jgi:hypothetical protein
MQQAGPSVRCVVRGQDGHLGSFKQTAWNGVVPLANDVDQAGETRWRETVG